MLSRWVTYFVEILNHNLLTCNYFNEKNVSFYDDNKSITLSMEKIKRLHYDVRISNFEQLNISWFPTPSPVMIVVHVSKTVSHGTAITFHLEQVTLRVHLTNFTTPALNKIFVSFQVRLVTDFYCVQTRVWRHLRTRSTIQRLYSY